MPRREKPIGYERWTWAEIDAGRRFTKAEKRSIRIAKQGGWQPQLDGSQQVPAIVAPLYIASLILMIAVAVLAPNGLAKAKGSEGALASLIFAGVGIFAIVYYLIAISVIRVKERRSNSKPTPTPQPDPLSLPPPPLPTERIEPPKPLSQDLFQAVRWCLTDGLELVGMVPVALWGFAKSVRRGFARWVGGFPDWVKAILAGLGFALPVIGMMIYLFR